MDEHEGRLTVGLLGPLAVARDGRPVEVTAGRLRALLAVLAATPGRPVSYERLGEAIWDGEPPSHLRRTLQTYAGRLRDLLGAERIGGGPRGLVLRLDEDDVDLTRFERLARGARERAEVEGALALWRGEAFEDVECDRLRRIVAPRLDALRLATLERRIDLDLAGGDPAAVAAELAELVAAHPLRETLWARLLVALDRCGRGAEALERYEAVRVRLAETLGVDPGPELRRLHGELLAGQDLTWGAFRTPASPVPRELPAVPPVFIGRDDALGLLDRSDRPVLVITGAGGVGKSTTALHWAHLAAHRFPDGQLHAELHGFSPQGAPTDPADVLARFLQALGVPPREIPEGLDARAALYRTVSADRRLLVVLDNARDTAQVTPLLPGAGPARTLVTSRNRLTGLFVAHRAGAVALPLLTAPEAHRLLAARLGAAALEREPEAAEAIVDACAGLPLALAVASARAEIEPDRPLAELAAQLRGEGLLDALDTGEAGGGVRAVISWSYRSVGREAARLFRALTAVPGPTASVEAAASLAGVPVPAARRLLDELAGARLAVETAPGRFDAHDLLRAFAVERAEIEDAPKRREAALRRLVLHYLHSAHLASRLLVPGRPPLEDLPDAGPAVAVAPLTTSAEAQAWYDAETTALIALVERCGDLGWDDLCWPLAWTAMETLQRRNRWRAWMAVEQRALASAERLGNRRWQAHSQRRLGRILGLLGELDEARAKFELALAVFAELGDAQGEAAGFKNLGHIEYLQGRHQAAVDCNVAALERYERLGDVNGQADALNNIGWCLAQLGEYDEAERRCRQGMDLYIGLGSGDGTAVCWDTLGYIHAERGARDVAESCYLRALEFYESPEGNPYTASETLVNLAENHVAKDEHDAAKDAYRRALEILERLGHRKAASVRAALTQLA
jgi:DNA-binding SARP family transcriptional activator/Tfp pilus assembly protein PilF